MAILLFTGNCASTEYIKYKNAEPENSIAVDKIEIYFDEYPAYPYKVIGKYTILVSAASKTSDIYRKVKKEIHKKNGHAGVIISDQELTDTWKMDTPEAGKMQKRKIIVYFLVREDQSH